MLESLFNKAVDLQICNFIKKRFQQKVFSCDYWEIFKNTYFEEHLRTAASVHSEDLLKYKNCVVKNMLQERYWHGFWVYKEKCHLQEDKKRKM